MVRKYDIYLPIEYNLEPNGTRRRIESEKFDDIELILLDEFGGVTSVQESFPFKLFFKKEKFNQKK